ncbi:MAG: carbon-nitrogen hydrolase family protein [Anaerolineales bacterium]|nr:MAG: carbon-nitrogen hydrolase family protein [Anaerolineales bacterium]
MTRLFGIAGVQMSVVPWNMDATLNVMADVAVNISRSFPWVDMVMYHELVVPGLVQFVTPEDKDWWKKNSEPIPGPASERLRALARKTRQWLVPGSMWELDGDKVYNTAIVISPEGEIVAKYRKMFPWLPYEAGTTPGDEFCVFDIPDVGRFGLCICYDMWFPEVSRQLAWMGAEVILQPTMTPTSDRELELAMARANALFNQCYFVSVNGIGTWGGGRSTIIDPDGRVLQTASTNQTFLTEMLDLDHTTRTREYGTLGLAQTIKQLRDAGHKFPIYEEDNLAKGSFAKLGALKFQRNNGGNGNDPRN